MKPSISKYLQLNVISTSTMLINPEYHLDARARAWVKNLYKLSDIKNTIAKNASL
jgi:hypothetical protein